MLKASEASGSLHVVPPKHRIAAAIGYMTASIAATLINKTILGVGKVSPLIIVFLQESTTLLLCGAAAWVSQTTIRRHFVQALDPSRLKACIPLGAAFCLYVGVSLRALQGLDVALYQCLHHLGVLAVIFFERLLLPAHSRQPVTPLAAVGLVGILVGAGVASTGESFQSKTEGGATMTAYVAMGAAIVFTALYVVLIKRSAVYVVGSTPFSLLLSNNALSLPVVVLANLVLGEFDTFFGSVVSQLTLSTAVGLILSAISGFGLNLAIFFNTSVNSPLTQSVCGQLKSCVLVLVGLFFSPPSKPAAFYAGICINLLGSSVYAAAQINSQTALPVKESSSSPSSSLLSTTTIEQPYSESMKTTDRP